MRRLLLSQFLPPGLWPRRALLSALLALTLVTAACSPEPASVETVDDSGPPSAVTSLGRLEPGLGVVEVGSPAGGRVLSLEAREGDVVAVGQVLVRLESHSVRRAELDLRLADREEALEALRRAKEIGPLAVRAREAEVRRLDADLALAESDFARTEALVGDGVLPDRELDFQSSVAEQARARLEHGRSVLEQERRIDRLEIRQAQARLASAEGAVEVARALFEQSEIRSPIEGTVLDVRVFAGEPTDGGAILILGETAKMVAVAEVYETDARFVRPGQRARVTSPALPSPLEGTVESVGALVARNDVLSLDPAARSDARVIEARIRLDDPVTAARFVHLQVDVRIDTASGAGSGG